MNILDQIGRLHAVIHQEFPAEVPSRQGHARKGFSCFRVGNVVGQFPCRFNSIYIISIGKSNVRCLRDEIIAPWDIVRISVSQLVVAPLLVQAHPDAVGYTSCGGLLARKASNLEEVLLVRVSGVKNRAIFHDLFGSNSRQARLFDALPHKDLILCVRRVIDWSGDCALSSNVLSIIALPKLVGSIARVGSRQPGDVSFPVVAVLRVTVGTTVLLEVRRIFRNGDVSRISSLFSDNNCFFCGIFDDINGSFVVEREERGYLPDRAIIRNGFGLGAEFRLQALVEAEMLASILTELERVGHVTRISLLSASNSTPLVAISEQLVIHILLVHVLEAFVLILRNEFLVTRYEGLNLFGDVKPVLVEGVSVCNSRNSC